jgi:hypothetical protein
MASSVRIFFAGIGTTFLIMGAGFGGGLMLAKSALQNPSVQTRATSQAIDSVRVILPTTAEAAEAPQRPAAVPVQAAVADPVVKVPEKQIEKVDTRKAEAEDHERKKRKARRMAMRAERQMEARRQIAQKRAPEPGIMAFGGDEMRPAGLFGN